jgi:hypothetical protein
MGLSTEIYQTLKKQLRPTILRLFHKIEKERTLLNSFYKTSIIPIPKSDKDTTKK